MTAGYSGTPLPQKLGIKAGHRVTLVGAPQEFEATLGLLPDEVALRRDGRATADVVIAFTTKAADLERGFPKLARRIPPDGGLWIAWPKRASGVPTDLSENAFARSASRPASSTTRSAPSTRRGPGCGSCTG